MSSVASLMGLLAKIETAKTMLREFGGGGARRNMYDGGVRSGDADESN